MKKKIFIFVIPLVAVLLSSLLLFTTADKKMQDFFQRPLKSTKENPAVLMVGIDDSSILNIGNWPFNRDVFADCLVTMKELGAVEAVFDLSFVDRSVPKLDESLLNDELPGIIQQDLEYLKTNTFTDDVILGDILSNLARLNQPFDKKLADGLAFFGNSYLNFNFDHESVVSEENIQQMEEKLAVKNMKVIKDTKTPSYSNALYVLPEFIDNAAGAGFCNADTDIDGYIRRVYPFIKFNDKYYGQMVLVPLLKLFGNPEIELTNKFVLLKNAKLPDGTEKNIKIPRDETGAVLLKYPKKSFVQYNYLSLWNIYRIHLLENTVNAILSEMNENGFFSYWNEENPCELFETANYMRQSLLEKDGSSGITQEAYFEYKNKFYSSLKSYLASNQKDVLLSEVAGDSELEEYVSVTFDNIKALGDDLISSRAKLSSTLENAICIFGTNATSTSDYSVNQYEDKYPNPGVHYTLANMILSQDFVDDCPFYVSLLIALVLCFVYSLISNSFKGTTRQIIAGLCFISGTAVLLLVYFIVTKQFPGFIVPVVSLSLTFISNVIMGFLTASKDKKFITNAFGQCLSKEVVAEIIANPSSFKLGGERLNMTAIFTDIQKFSSFSELLSAAQLVALLNYYLTKMSDIIMDERGTVDKYEGDAIIALVGAPVVMEDHAVRAVKAALKMKAAEVEMNKEILRFAISSRPEAMDEELYSAFKIMVENKKTLFTRIGINSGEMIAGYMGSENKKNYTMMGNNVNLASRLEGVNKQYSTSGILISEATKDLLGDEFILRRLDKVRVVNVNTPIRLYEPLSLKADADDNLIKYVFAWEKAMDMFENKDYEKSYELLKKLSEYKTDDKVAKYYISLLEKFFLKGKYPVEADDVGVEYNPADGVFKLLQK